MPRFPIRQYLSRELPLKHFATTLLRSNYLSTMAASCVSQNRVSALIGSKTNRPNHWQWETFQTNLGTLTDSPNPDAAVIGAAAVRRISTIAAPQAPSFRGKLLPKSETAPAKGVVIYDHKDHFLQLKTLSSPTSADRVWTSLDTDPGALIDGWKRQPFRWQLFTSTLELCNPHTPNSQPHSQYIICGMAEHKAAYLENWSSLSNVDIELEAILPYSLAALFFLKDTILASQDTPAFSLIYGQDNLRLSFWNNTQFTYLADFDPDQLNRISEVLNEIWLEHCQTSDSHSSLEPSQDPIPVYLFARTNAELVTLTSQVRLSAPFTTISLDTHQIETHTGKPLKTQTTLPGTTSIIEPESHLLGYAVENLLQFS